MITRRDLFGVLAGAVAAPIVVRSGLLMPVKAVADEHVPGMWGLCRGVWREISREVVTESGAISVDWAGLGITQFRINTPAIKLDMPRGFVGMDTRARVLLSL